MTNELVKIDRTKPYEFTMNGQKQSVQLNDPTSYSVFNDSEYLIVNDQDFEKYAKLVPDEEKTKYYGYYIEDWKSTEESCTRFEKRNCTRTTTEFPQLSACL